ncbi:unnamed protein product, partial [Owenia fusiformis]
NMNKVQKVCETAETSLFNAVLVVKELDERLVDIIKHSNQNQDIPAISDDKQPAREVENNDGQSTSKDGIDEDKCSVDTDHKADKRKQIDRDTVRKTPDEAVKVNSIDNIDFGLAAEVAKDPYNTALIMSASKTRGRQRGMAKRGGMGRGMARYRPPVLVYEAEGEDSESAMSAEELETHYENAYRAIDKLKGHRQQLPNCDRDVPKHSITKQQSPRQERSHKDIDMRIGRDSMQQEPAVISPFHAHLTNSIKQGNWDNQAQQTAGDPSHIKHHSDPYMQAIEDMDYSKNKEVITIQTLQEALENMPQDDPCKIAMQLSINTLISKLPIDCKEYLNRCRKETAGTTSSTHVNDKDSMVISGDQTESQTAHFQPSAVAVPDAKLDQITLSPRVNNTQNQVNDVQEDVKRSFCHDDSSKIDVFEPIAMEISAIDGTSPSRNTASPLQPTHTTLTALSSMKEPSTSTELMSEFQNLQLILQKLQLLSQILQ